MSTILLGNESTGADAVIFDTLKVLAIYVFLMGTCICVSKLTIIVAANWLYLGRRLAINKTNAGILSNEPLGTYFSDILTDIYTFSFKKMYSKMSGKWRPFCLGFNVLFANYGEPLFSYTFPISEWSRSIRSSKKSNSWPHSLNGKTSYCKISWNFGVVRFVLIIIASLWNMTGISAALLPMCLSNFRVVEKFQTRSLWLRDFTRSRGKTPVRLVTRGPDILNMMLFIMKWHVVSKHQYMPN